MQYRKEMELAMGRCELFLRDRKVGARPIYKKQELQASLLRSHGCMCVNEWLGKPALNVCVCVCHLVSQPLIEETIFQCFHMYGAAGATDGNAGYKPCRYSRLSSSGAT